MATMCPSDFNVNDLREQVRATYDRVARDPDGDFHFHRGPEYAQTLEFVKSKMYEPSYRSYV